jgi:glutamyl-tRNA reductase
MSVLAVGVSHRTAPVVLLEQVTVGVGDAADLAAELRGGPVVEAVVLATCNRVEVYADVATFHGGLDAVTDLLVAHSGVPLEQLQKSLYVHYEDQAVLHLFEVACGLDSMVIGEAQILGQLRRSYGAASAGAGRTLHELFQKALKVGKRAHSETGIDEAGRSLVSVGLEQAMAVVGPLEGRRALIVGSGSMGALAGATLRRGGVADVVVANRTVENALRLAHSLEGTGIGLDGLEGALVDADVVVTSTGATGQVISRDVVARAVARRGGRPLALLDLALPRDVDPAVREVPGVTLVDLEQLAGVLRDSATGGDVKAVRAIVAEEVGAFLAWQRASRVAPTVAALRARADQVVRSELDRLSTRVPDLPERSRAEVEQAVRRVVDKLLHTPTVRVKELTDPTGGVSYAEALQELFGLDRKAPSAVVATGLHLQEQP